MWAANQVVDPHELETLRYWASRRGAISFEDLLNEYPHEHRLAAFAYVQSLSIVSYLVAHEGGIGTILDLIARYQRRTLEEAWEATYGEEPEATWERWRRFEARAFSPLRFLLRETPAFFVPAVLFLLAYLRFRIRRWRFYREAD